MTVKERLIEFIKYKDLSFRQFEFHVGLANGYITALKANIGSDKLQMIIEKYPDLNIEWLLSGHGSMLKQNSPIIMARGNTATSIGNNNNVNAGNIANGVDAKLLEVIKRQDEDIKISRKHIDDLISIIKDMQGKNG